MVVAARLQRQHAERGIVIELHPRRAGARGVVVGEDAGQVRVGGDRVVDLARRRVEVVVVEPGGNGYKQDLCRKTGNPSPEWSCLPPPIPQL